MLNIDLIKISTGTIGKYYYVHKHSLGKCLDTGCKSQDDVFMKELRKVNTMGFCSSLRANQIPDKQGEKLGKLCLLI